MTEFLQFLGDLVKIVLPASLVLYGIYLVIKNFLNKEFDRKLLDLRTQVTNTILPVRLQAYERMSIFLERMMPVNLITRVNDPNFNVAVLQHQMIMEIRNEFNHNLSQQIYMSEKAWEAIRAAKEDLILLINTSAQDLNPEASSIELAKRIMATALNADHDLTKLALSILKEEIQKIF